MVRNVTLTIDRKSVTVPENTTILEAARSSTMGNSMCSGGIL